MLRLDARLVFVICERHDTVLPIGDIDRRVRALFTLTDASSKALGVAERVLDTGSS